MSTLLFTMWMNLQREIKELAIEAPSQSDVQ